MYFSLPKTFMHIQTLDILLRVGFRKGFDEKYVLKYVLFLFHFMSKFQELLRFFSILNSKKFQNIEME